MHSYIVKVWYLCYYMRSDLFGRRGVQSIFFVIFGIVTSSLYQDAIIRISYIFVCWIDSYYDIFVVINVYISYDYIFKILVKPMSELWCWSREWEAKVRSPSSLGGPRSPSVYLRILKKSYNNQGSIQNVWNLWKKSVRGRNYLLIDCCYKSFNGIL